MKETSKLRRRVLQLAAGASGVVLMAGLAACDSDDSNGNGDSNGSDSDHNGDDNGDDEADGSDPGSALPAGSTVSIGDWEVTLGDIELDAAETVANENQFNDEPADGHQFVLAEIDATYTGEDSGNFWVDVALKVYGSDGNTFDSRCGVIPNDITDAGETFADGNVTGNKCVEVESDQLDGGKWILEELISLGDDSRHFIDIE